MRIAIIHHHLHPGCDPGHRIAVKSLRHRDDYQLTIHTGDPLQPLSFHGTDAEVFVCEPLQYLSAGLTKRPVPEKF